MQTQTKLAYFGVFWAEHLRIEKARTPKEACQRAFGMATADMRVKRLTTRKSDLVTNKTKAVLLANPEKWPTFQG